MHLDPDDMQIASTPAKSTQVLVFRTSIQTLEEKQKILSALTSAAEMEEVSIDFEDVDKVLRVVTDEQPHFFINLLQTLDIRCSELD